ncbi:MAG: YajQ family cyclic di-GMP-binding protein [Deltaproteobacteria bacterium]|nr:YajQ family cyclic di-GMP-binding protein [Deltaproteobacteria bacterium]
MPSFDVVSRVDMQEVDNAVNQTKKEINGRYDFRNSKSKVELEKEAITITADDDMKLKAIQEILSQKIAKRGVGVRALDFKEAEKATGMMLKQKVMIKQGISQDDGKAIVKLIKEAGLKKIQAQIQQDQVRITGPKKDDLQEVIKLLREKVKLELQFVNMKD